MFSSDAAGIDPEIGTRSFGGCSPATARGRRRWSSRSTVLGRQRARHHPGSVVSGDGIAFNRDLVPGSPPDLTCGRARRASLRRDAARGHSPADGDSDSQVTSDQVITTLGTRLTLGLAHRSPFHTGERVPLGVSFSASLDDGEPDSSTVSRLSGPDLTQREDVITGLPRAKANDAINSIHFGPDGSSTSSAAGSGMPMPPPSTEPSTRPRCMPPIPIRGCRARRCPPDGARRRSGTSMAGRNDGGRA